MARVSLIALAGFTLLGCQSVTTPSTQPVTVLTIERVTGYRIAGTLVEGESGFGYSNENGIVTLTVPIGRSLIRASHPGFTVENPDRVVLSGQTVTFALTGVVTP